jgi:GntR family transcriptional regulator/MocR family aminotransferase
VTIVVPIDRDSPVPLTRQIYEFWRAGIASGRFPGGERVPSTRDAAAALGLSRGTIAQAYEQLMSEGYFQAVRGSGTYVCRELPERDALLPGESQVGPEPHDFPGGEAAGFVDIGGSVKLSSLGEELRRDDQPAQKREGYISLAPAGPDLSLFPLDLWRRLSVSSLKSIGTGALDYAEHGQGYLPLREEIAKYVSRTRGISCSPDEIVVVSGSQQGLDLCARLFLEPDDEVALENPGYVGARRVFEACGARLRPVRVDVEGVVCSELGESARLAYVTPARQFPIGVALSPRRRRELLAWARQRRAVIVEDDYDSDYRYGGTRMPALYGASNDVAVIYCGSFSKVMFPGLRIGYVIVPQSLVSTFARAKWLADRHTPVHQQATLHRFMSEGHLERHIRRMRRTYAQRRAVLVESLERYFGERVQVFGEAAGTHAYVRIDDPGVAARAERNKVQLREADRYYIGAAPRNEYLFEFSMLSERSIREGVRRVAPSARGPQSPGG